MQEVELPPNHQAVESSNIKSLAFLNPDATGTGTLEILFKSGVIWQYKNVHRELAEELQKAESVGSFFAQRIKARPELFEASRVGQWPKD